MVVVFPFSFNSPKFNRNFFSCCAHFSHGFLYEDVFTCLYGFLGKAVMGYCGGTYGDGVDVWVVEYLLWVCVVVYMVFFASLDTVLVETSEIEARFMLFIYDSTRTWLWPHMP